jgi:hypothetical protein
MCPIRNIYKIGFLNAHNNLFTESATRYKFFFSNLGAVAVINVFSKLFLDFLCQPKTHKSEEILSIFDIQRITNYGWLT